MNTGLRMREEVEEKITKGILKNGEEREAKRYITE